MLEVSQIAALWLLRRIWFSLPLLVTVGLMLAMLAPLNLTGMPAPDIGMIAVFYWAISGPAFMPAWAVLLLGLVQDFATGAPLGFWPLIYLFAYGFTLSQRVFFAGRTGFGVWIGFALVAAVAAVATWVLGSIVYMRWLPAGQIWLQAFMSVAIYWPVAKVFGLMRGRLTKAREAI